LFTFSILFLFSGGKMRLTKARKSGLSVSPALEALEGRVLMSGAPEIARAIADNRGQVTLIFNEELNTASVNKQSVEIFTAGPSGNPANGDHIQQKVNITYYTDVPGTASSGIIATVKHGLPAGTPYELVVKDTVTDNDGVPLQGTFNGASNFSGNGAPGTYRFVTGGEGQKTAIFATANGPMYVNLIATATAPALVKNFLAYANAGAWDNTFFNRLTTVDNSGYGIIQGGSYTIAGPKQLGTVPDLSTPSTGVPADTSTGLSNATVGTLSMGIPGGSDAATNAFFFNYTSNANLNTQNGGYSVIGQIASGDAVSQAILASLTGLTTVDISSRQLVNSPGNPEFTNVPTLLQNFGTPPTAGNFVNDLEGAPLFVTRVSVEMAISAAAQTPIVAAPNMPAAAALQLSTSLPVVPANIIDYSSVFGNNLITSGTETDTVNSGTSTTTDSYVNGVLVSSTTVTTLPSEEVSSVLQLDQNNPGSTLLLTTV
jgi:cyclophilin family peptidyl-prolyl cis-trans isomerase